MTTIRNIFASTLAVVLLGAIMAAAPRTATAQDLGEFDEMDQALGGALGEFVQWSVNYWIPKLNDYRTRIDASLPTAEVNELNLHRTQWAILMEQMADERRQVRDQMRQQREEWEAQQKEEAARMDESTEATIDVAVAVEAPIAVPEYDTTAAEDFVAMEEIEVADAYEYDDENVEAEYHFDDACGGEYEEPYSVHADMESHRDATEELAMRNLTRLEWMPAEVKDDLREYIVGAVKFIDTYITEHRGELMASELGMELVSGWEKEVRPEIQEGLAEKFDKEFDVTDTEDFFDEVGTFLLLYNGGDLSSLIGMALPQAEPMAKTALSEHTMLSQNTPNPASGSTTINYTLAESSSRTVLQLFDSRGEVVKTLDQGSRQPGSHSVNVDLSTLPAGNYLYRLSIQTAAGEQIESRVLQVIR
jgi:hypothetical protein